MNSKNEHEAHIAFELIHPFIDGNGRTGRMLMWWMEVKAGKIPTLIKFEDRWMYYKWFDATKYPWINKL